MKTSALTIRTRLVVAFGLIIIVLMLLAATSLYGINTTGRDLDEVYQNRLIPLNQMARINDLMRQNIQQLTIATISHASTEDVENYLVRVQNNLEKIDNLTNIFFEGNLSDDERSLAEQWVKERDVFIDQGVKPTMANLSAGGFMDAQDAITGVGGQLYKKTQTIMDKLIDVQMANANRINNDAQSHVLIVRAVVTTTIIIVCLFCVAVFFVIRSIITPLSSLVGDINILASGQTQLMISGLGRGDEIGLLAGALEKWKNAIADTQTARDEARERARQLEILNASIHTMLDSLGQGILSFGANGLCSNVFSKACLTIFETSPAHQTIFDVLKLASSDKVKFENILNLLFGKKETLAMPPQSLLDMLPRQYAHSKGLSVSLQYRPIMDNAGKIQSVMIVATDRTEQEAALRFGREREAKASMILRVSANDNDFKHFYQSIVSFFETPDEAFADNADLEQLKRDVHTFKGSASIYYLQDLANALHQLETLIEDAPSMQHVRAGLPALLAVIMAALMSVKEDAAKILGIDFDKQGMTRTIPLPLLKKMAAQLRSIPHTSELYKQFIKLLMGEPIHKILSDFETGIQELANRYGKAIGLSRFMGENFQILTEIYQPLLATLPHIFRNIVDHGIEDPSVRAQYGKPLACTITFETHLFERQGREWISLSITDDGNGISTDSLRKSLRTRGYENKIADASDKDILQYIFEDGVSGKNTVTELSGRGIGMGAVKHEANRLGGTVQVESEPHRFTRITLEMPYYVELPLTG